MTTQNFLYCHEDLDRAAAVGGAMAASFYTENSHLLWTREAYPTSAYQSLGNQATKQMKEAGAPGDKRALPEGIAIGDPHRLIEELRKWESVGVDGVNFIAQHVRGGAAGGRARVAAPVRRRGPAEVPPVGLPAVT